MVADDRVKNCDDRSCHYVSDQFQALFTQKLIYSLYYNSHMGRILFSLHFTDGETEACSLKTCPGSHRKQSGRDLSTSNLAPDPRLLISSPKAAPSIKGLGSALLSVPVSPRPAAQHVVRAHLGWLRK